jgi:hypothetical protein
MNRIKLNSEALDGNQRTRMLAKIFTQILSWPDPQKETDPADDLSSEVVAGSQSPLIQPDYPKASNDPDEIEQNI